MVWNLRSSRQWRRGRIIILDYIPVRLRTCYNYSICQRYTAVKSKNPKQSSKLKSSQPQTPITPAAGLTRRTLNTLCFWTKTNNVSPAASKEGKFDHNLEKSDCLSRWLSSLAVDPPSSVAHIIRNMSKNLGTPKPSLTSIKKRLASAISKKWSRTWSPKESSQNQKYQCRHLSRSKLNPKRYPSLPSKMPTFKLTLSTDYRNWEHCWEQKFSFQQYLTFGSLITTDL